MQNKTAVGLIGIAGIWITSGLALPFVNILTMFEPEQLMLIRGFVTAILALLFIKSNILRADIYTKLIFIALPLATVGLFYGIRAWGVSSTLIVIAATPIVNIIAGIFQGRKITLTSCFCLILVLCGVILSSKTAHFNIGGLAWSLFGTVMSGIVFELFSKSSSSPMHKCFYGSMGMGTAGLIISIFSQPSWEGLHDPYILSIVTGFVLIGGFLYWIANIIAFNYLPPTEASILAQGETIAVIIGAYIFLDEVLTLIQWLGVITTILAASVLSYALAKNNA